MTFGVIIILVFISLLEFLTFIALKHAFRIKTDNSNKRYFKYIFWFCSLIILLSGFTYFVYLRLSSDADYIKYRNYFKLSGLFFVFYIPKIFFITFYLAEFIIRIPAMFLKQKKNNNKFVLYFASLRILSITGAMASAIFCLIIIHGIFIGRTNFKIERISLAFNELPESFNGVRIAVISDTHLGSFSDSLDVKKGIDLLMAEKPDIIFFTGDLVNNESEEAEAMMCELTRMHAPLGMYSILGNHDIGDYRRWKTIEEKNANLELLKSLEKKAGFKLLIDENYVLKKGNDSIVIIGVNSWGLPPFKSYGNLNKAMNGIKEIPFKILLTHSPVHWDHEVAGKNDIELTFSGHTHAMQFGLNCCNIFWSPVEWIYPHWAGLYNYGDQYLYINRGFGYIGFPGRIGMTPEITIVELKRK